MSGQTPTLIKAYCKFLVLIKKKKEVSLSRSLICFLRNLQKGWETERIDFVLYISIMGLSVHFYFKGMSPPVWKLASYVKFRRTLSILLTSVVMSSYYLFGSKRAQ